MEKDKRGGLVDNEIGQRIASSRNRVVEDDQNEKRAKGLEERKKIRKASSEG